jgi:2-polyprenyl-6-methoxyphenol hydroxylase-like FAD-dependent oxidoreductase
MKHTICILGGGIAGLTTAIALKKKGIESIIFEASPEIKAVGAGLGLGINAMMAFDRLGLKEDISQLGKMLPSFTIFDQKGKTITRTTDFGDGNFTIHRAALHEYLLSQLDPANIRLGKKVQGLTQDENGVTLTFEDGSEHACDYVIAADGIHSPVRAQLVPHYKPRYAGYTCWRAVIDNAQLQLNETSETWGAKGRFGLVPLANNKIYWFACVNAPQNSPEAKKYGVSDLQKIFKDYHSPIPEVLAQTHDHQLIWGDIIDHQPIDRYAYGRVVLIGDAAHATTPNMGQGACQAIEDAVVLAQCMAENAQPTLAFKTFEKRRLKRTKWVTNNSWMIGKVAQWTNPFLILKRNFLFRLLPASVNKATLKKLEAVDI